MKAFIFLTLLITLWRPSCSTECDQGFPKFIEWLVSPTTDKMFIAMNRIFENISTAQDNLRDQNRQIRVELSAQNEKITSLEEKMMDVSNSLSSCLFNGQTLHNGEITTDKVQCQFLICHNGRLEETTATEPYCNETFTCVVGTGCIKIIPSEETRSRAGSKCADMKARLATPHDLALFHNYMLRQKSDKWYWVGIKMDSPKWTDGRVIPSNLCDPSSTSGCGGYFNNMKYLFKMTPCNDGAHYVCQQD